MFWKQLFDYIFALILLIVLVGLIFCMILIATIDTKEFGLFKQNRVGQFGKSFKIYKIRTMKGVQHSTITTHSHRITRIGKFLRDYKLDELPQLFNILMGDMSFVGPRPDVEGYADRLKGQDRIILQVKPGITGLAQLKYRNEEQILSMVEHPIEYNDKVIWPDKVNINKEYVEKWTFQKDLYYILKTVLK
ncbi:sugar transferase [Faecalibacter sp. LW9]|uniref:sugar transferase n=1 Tax=Faecalibacter sp. LW9 TaxID=3103144 RepID=UPI002AFF8373|nr:sugar transferase [Faecalibacter sp. LW9]